MRRARSHRQRRLAANERRDAGGENAEARRRRDAGKDKNAGAQRRRDAEGEKDFFFLRGVATLLRRAQVDLTRGVLRDGMVHTHAQESRIRW